MPYQTSTLILDFSASKTMRNAFLLWINHSIYGILLLQCKHRQLPSPVKVSKIQSKASEGDILSRGKGGHRPVWRCAFSYTKYFSPWHYGPFALDSSLMQACSTHVRLSHNITGFYTLDAINASPVVKTKNDSRHCQVSPREQICPFSFGNQCSQS